MLLRLLLIWILLVSIFAFFRMGWDKRRANNKQSRVSEKHFFILAAIGGTLGILLGMRIWRHKTQKWKFKGPIYGILAAQLLVIIALVYLFIESGGTV